MRSLARRIVFLAAVAGAAAAGPGPEESAERAIRAVLDRQVEDWNRGDLDAFCAAYWQSPRLVFQAGGERHDGWEAMRARYRKKYQSEGRVMGRLTFSGLEIEPLGDDAAFARGRWRLELPDGTRPGGLFTLILRRLPQGWRIVHDHTSTG